MVSHHLTRISVDDSLPIVDGRMMEFAALPEYFVEDMADYLLFLARFGAEVLLHFGFLLLSLSLALRLLSPRRSILFFLNPILTITDGFVHDICVYDWMTPIDWVQRGNGLASCYKL